MLKQLLERKAEIEQRLAAVQEELQAVNIDIGHAISEKLVELRSLSGKEFGTVHLSLDGYKVTETVPKNVSWDQAKLSDLFDRISAAGDNPRDYMKLKLEVGEKQFESFAPELKNIFAEARTVKPGRPQVSFEEVANA